MPDTKENKDEETKEDNIETQGEQELDEAAKLMKDQMWIDSMLLNFTEEISVGIPDPNDSDAPDRTAMRRISMGITVKSSSRVPMRIMKHAASKSLNKHFEEERDKWLDEEAVRLTVNNARMKMKAEAKELKDGERPKE